MGKLSDSARAKLLKYPPELYEQVYGLYEDGVSATKIAGTLGYNLTRNSVIGLINRAIKAGRLTRRVGYIRVQKFHKPVEKKVTVPKKVAAKPVLTLVPVVHEEPPEGLTLQQLKHHHCRWTQDSRTFCGKPRMFKSWWCEEHHNIVYRQGTAFNKRTKR